ncbi:nitrile hydratase subunit alpha [Pseudomonas corrugata]|uniref:nitrile hydratase subunit alpha n=1 Tax=Pseudomonas corrugata TaxID=47879 RepID=UPI0006D8AF7D|nr:nitrile hydratase subunit alpha [Pseudomonas corrugata]
MDHSQQTKASAQLRAEALREALKARDLISDDFIQGLEDVFSSWVPENGAKVVARAWSDSGFRERLLANGTTACAELGFGGDEGGFIVALENKPELQNVIVCSLCSCTAWPIIGLPPEWYKSFEYRSRVVREPRKVLAELGLDLDPDIKIQVWDTTAETRYFVLPQRPEGTEGWTEDDLAALVTKDVLIGVALPSVTPSSGRQ